MAEMLTYRDGQSTGYAWNREGILQSPDENFAREIMQLFTIGLYELNQDGTPVLDENGNQIRTYDNDVITEMARVYTGFRRRDTRGNVEMRWSNRVDPLYIQVDWRDNLPKVSLSVCTRRYWKLLF